VGFDLKTGRLLKTIPTDEIFGQGGHVRCWRSRITEKYLLTSLRGAEFIDLATGDIQQSHFIRSGCLLGSVPCNGLLYIAPHGCRCFGNTLLTGFNAFATDAQYPKEAFEITDKGQSRLIKGPAYDKITATATSAHDWPAYRHDARRSGATESAVDSKLEVAWQTKIDADPSESVKTGQ